MQARSRSHLSAFFADRDALQTCLRAFSEASGASDGRVSLRASSCIGGASSCSITPRYCSVSPGATCQSASRSFRQAAELLLTASESPATGTNAQRRFVYPDRSKRLILILILALQSLDCQSASGRPCSTPLKTMAKRGCLCQRVVCAYRYSRLLTSEMPLPPHWKTNQLRLSEDGDIPAPPGNRGTPAFGWHFRTSGYWSLLRCRLQPATAAFRRAQKGRHQVLSCTRWRLRSIQVKLGGFCSLCRDDPSPGDTSARACTQRTSEQPEGTLRM